MCCELSEHLLGKEAEDMQSGVDTCAPQVLNLQRLC